MLGSRHSLEGGFLLTAPPYPGAQMPNHKQGCTWDRVLEQIWRGGGRCGTCLLAHRARAHTDTHERTETRARARVERCCQHTSQMQSAPAARWLGWTSSAATLLSSLGSLRFHEGESTQWVTWRACALGGGGGQLGGVSLGSSLDARLKLALAVGQEPRPSRQKRRPLQRPTCKSDALLFSVQAP
jgi:hypothetical protein